MYNFTIEQILEAIKDSAGIMSIVAQRLNCSWDIAKNYVEKYEDSKIAFRCEKEKNIDKAESVILSAVNNNDIQTAKWYLMTIGKNRGYSEKREISLLTNNEDLTQEEEENLKQDIKGLIEKDINE